MHVVQKPLKFPLLVTVVVRDVGERCKSALCSFCGSQSNFGRPLNERKCDVTCGSSQMRTILLHCNANGPQISVDLRHGKDRSEPNDIKSWR